MVHSVCSSLYNILPQNIHARRVETLKKQISQLEIQANDTTSSLFQQAVQTVISELQEKKQRLIQDLTYLNGSFYEDPASILKQKWDLFFAEPKENTHHSLLGSEYLNAQLQRDRLEEELITVIGSLKAHHSPLLKTDEAEAKLNLRLKELCGNHYEDPSSLLDRAWKVYQSALQYNAPEKEILYSRYSSLERERRTIEAQLYRLGQEKALCLNINESIFVHAKRKIDDPIIALSYQCRNEESLAGIDWPELGKMTLIAGGAAGMTYLFSSLS